uniref:LysM peptidoglycan-binding domain-containing protein n=1 Tax=Enterococcus songbeiensis TaxID=2559927 RepID=UPI0010F8F8FE
GDSVWLIANKYGITMNQLIQWNNIKNNFIYPGQRLVVKNGGTNNSSTTTGSSSSSLSSSSASSSASTGGTYTVKSGDSVWSIANKHGISMDQFRQWNNIKNDFVYPGQKVTVKKGATASAASTSGSTYKVKSGDSLWTIAQKYRLTINQLKSLNQLSSDTILIGQTLKVK